MNDHSSFGWLLPLWIIGASFVAGLFQLFTSPAKASRRHAPQDPSPRAESVVRNTA